jgi:hypothetical protein
MMTTQNDNIQISEPQEAAITNYIYTYKNLTEKRLLNLDSEKRRNMCD